MATTGMKDLLRRAFRAKDEGELSQIEKEAEGGGTGAEGDGGMHIHVHPGDDRRGGRRRDERETEGGEGGEGGEAGAELGKVVNRLQALESDMEEMKAQHEEMLSELSEDSRKRINGRRDRRRRDGRRYDASEEERRREEEDSRRRRDASEAEEKRKKEEEEKAAEDARRRDEANHKIEGDLEMEAPPGTGDKARKAHDSAYLEDSFQTTIAMAEILVPGQSFPTYDRAAEPKKTLDAICALRRQTLDMAYNRPELRSAIDDAVGGNYPERVKVMDCGEIRTLFRSTAAFQRQRNNAGNGHRAADHTDDSFFLPVGGVRTPAEMNKAAREHWAKQKA